MARLLELRLVASASDFKSILVNSAVWIRRKDLIMRLKVGEFYLKNEKRHDAK